MLHPHPHRTWFPFILVGLTVALLLFVVIWVNEKSEDTYTDDQPEVVEVISAEEYQQEMNSVFTEFLSSKNVNLAYDQLLDIRVPSRYKDVHLELVIILAKYRAGDVEEAIGRYDALKAQINWLP
ncbi:MAG: hypothetical protein Q8P30_03770 [Candidatus Uhrbacteria bacterium]|nr:hypothetical protein [Candidatus Uhrbacteria bacterium]